MIYATRGFISKKICLTKKSKKLVHTVIDTTQLEDLLARFV